MLVKTFLLLGTNLGDREKQLQSAIQKIETQIGTVLHVSSIYETAPWGNIPQPNYLNQVVALETALSVEDVLQTALRIEQELGRIREIKWGARIIDIDILYYGQEIRQTESLVVPHPFLQERRFTLIPLVEIAPTWQHPVLHLSNEELLTQCPDQSDVNIFVSSKA